MTPLFCSSEIKKLGAVFEKKSKNLNLSKKRGVGGKLAMKPKMFSTRISSRIFIYLPWKFHQNLSVSLEVNGETYPPSCIVTHTTEKILARRERNYGRFATCTYWNGPLGGNLDIGSKIKSGHFSCRLFLYLPWKFHQNLQSRLEVNGERVPSGNTVHTTLSENARRFWKLWSLRDVWGLKWPFGKGHFPVLRLPSRHTHTLY